jgi:hypothetical protein
MIGVHILPPRPRYAHHTLLADIYSFTGFSSSSPGTGTWVTLLVLGEVFSVGGADVSSVLEPAGTAGDEGAAGPPGAGEPEASLASRAFSASALFVAIFSKEVGSDQNYYSPSSLCFCSSTTWTR